MGKPSLVDTADSDGCLGRRSGMEHRNECAVQSYQARVETENAKAW